jgi:transcriptional regulator with XRE-family HTH domain
MAKTLIGPRLRQLRRERGQTQAEMARELGVSTAYVNLLESNQRSLSVQMLMALTDTYGVDWRDILADDGTSRLADLRNALRDPIFEGRRPDGQELRAMLDHAPGLAEGFLHLHRSYRALLERMMHAEAAGAAGVAVGASPEARLHDFFRNHDNHFATLERAADALRADIAPEVDTGYDILRARLRSAHRIGTAIVTVEDMPDSLRFYDAQAGRILLSEALDHQNRVFQLAPPRC